MNFIVTYILIAHATNVRKSEPRNVAMGCNLFYISGRLNFISANEGSPGRVGLKLHDQFKLADCIELETEDATAKYWRANI